jgi:hypothetical protein
MALHLYSVANLSQNLLIRNKDYVPIVFYSSLLSSLSSSSEEHMRLSLLYRMKSSCDTSGLFKMLHFLKLFSVNPDEIHSHAPFRLALLFH